MLRCSRLGIFFTAFLVIISAQVAWANLPTRAVVLSGQQAPGHGQFRTLKSAIAINDHGEVVFRAYDADDGGVWLAEPSRELISLQHAGNQAPGFPVGHLLSDPGWDPIYSYLNESSQTLVSSTVDEQQVTLLAAPGSLRLLGQSPGPPTTGGLTAVHLNDAGHVILIYLISYGSSEGTFLAGPPEALQTVGTGDLANYPMLDNAGNIAFLGSRSGQFGLWFGPPSNPQRIATDDSNHRLGTPYLSKNGHLAFEGPTGPADRPGLFVSTPGATPTLVLRTGDPAPGLPGQTMGMPTLPTINDAGEVAFLASAGSSTMFWAGHPGAIKPLFVPGAPAPGDVDGLTFANFGGGGLPMLNDAGQIVFSARYLNTLTSEIGYGLWASDPDGTLSLIAREHGPLEFDGQTRTVSLLGRFDINDLGQIVFGAQFTDGSSGIFVATIPEPTVTMLLIPLLFLSRRRR
jgi:hypothetical protein